MNGWIIPRLFETFDKLAYGILSIVGCYFIYKGGVLQRFNERKTFFVEYDEPVRELPSLLTYIDSPIQRDLKYGIDFNLSFGYGVKPCIPLNLGKNFIDTYSNPLEVDLEALWDGTVFRITPQNLPTDEKALEGQVLEYTFDKPSAITKVNLQLTTKTGGALDGNGERFNSKEERFQADVKKSTTVVFLVKKRIFLKGKECHPAPADSSNYIQIQDTLKYMESKNFTVCKPAGRSFGTPLNKILQHLPDCKTMTEYFRFEFELNIAKSKTLAMNPCTKINYEGSFSVGSLSNYENASAKFYLQFLPPAKVNVKEEYLIYDTVALISSIGGTLGICIGFSFYNIVSVMLCLLELGIRTITKKRKKADGGKYSSRIGQRQKLIDLLPNMMEKDESKTALQTDVDIISTLFKSKLKEESLSKFEGMVEKIVDRRFRQKMCETTQDPYQK